MTDPQNVSLVATGDNTKQIGYIRNIEVFNQIIQITSWQQLETLQLKIASPYKGLKSFEAVDQRLFFGRDQFLKERFKELEQTNLILLLGASGSGKSSVVRAGMIPRLVESMGSQFIDLTFIPKHDPFTSLYNCLHDRYPKLDWQFVLEGKTETLVQAVNRLKPADDFWFIFIDQFEELFTLSQVEKRDRFIESLVQLVKTLDKTQNGSVKIIATMRADFLDRLSPYPTLVKRTDQHRPFIAEMQLDELRLAIEQPALHHGVMFENGLVEEIIKDVQGQSGYLPLLQYTLDLLWKLEVETGSIHDRTLNVINYRSLGGVRGTLQKHVEEVYQKLSQPEKQAVQRVFLKLVGIGGDEEAETEWKPIRRRANRSEFDEQLEQKMVARLINENLLVSNHETQSQESTIEIAHEVLLTSWTTLSTWIQENRQAIALRNRLNDDVKRWQTTKKEDELWSGSKLEQVVELRKDATFNQVLGGFSPVANQFIDASIERRDRKEFEKLSFQIELETERQQKQIAQQANQILAKAQTRAKQIVRFGFAIMSLSILLGILFIVVLPSYAIFLNNRGYTKYEFGQFQEALQDFELALTLKPGYEQVYFNRGLVYEKLNNFDLARANYQAAVRQHFAPAYINLGRLQITWEQNYIKAIELLEQGTHLETDDETRYSLFKNLGWAQLKLKQYNRAEQNLQKAVALNSQRGSAYCLLAQVLEEKKAMSEAQDQWKKCLEFGNPNHPDESNWIDLAKSKIEKKGL